MLTLAGRVIVLALFLWWQGLLVIYVVATASAPTWIYWVGSLSCALVGFIGAMIWANPDGRVGRLIYGESAERRKSAKELIIGSAWTSLSIAAIAVHLSWLDSMVRE